MSCVGVLMRVASDGSPLFAMTKDRRDAIKFASVVIQWNADHAPVGFCKVARLSRQADVLRDMLSETDSLGVDNMPKIPTTEEEWLACLPLPEYLSLIPSGCIRPVFGPIIWTDGTGKQMNTEQYIKKWGFDPQIAWDAIKSYRKQSGKDDHVVRL